jgi:hypothetical protein
MCSIAPSARFGIAAILLIAACSSGPAAVGPADSAEKPSSPWKRVMHEVGEHFEFLDRGISGTPTADLDEVARRATQAADLIRTGYGVNERKDVPGFANYARATEAWLLQLAMEAGQQHLDIVRNLMVDAEARHCGGCHDAYERVRQ